MDPSQKPVVTVPISTPPPAELVHEDLVVGDGAVVADGGSVIAHVLLVAWSTGEELYSTWEDAPVRIDPQSPLSPPAIERIAGMRVGGRRKVIAPPSTGWGDAGTPLVDASETIVGVVDILEIA